MEVGIWSKPANYITDKTFEINKWITENERRGLKVVDKIVKMAPEMTGSSSYREPWVVITVWMDKVL